jgi:hypothetical protein
MGASCRGGYRKIVEKYRTLGGDGNHTIVVARHLPKLPDAAFGITKPPDRRDPPQFFAGLPFTANLFHPLPRSAIYLR